MLFPELQQARGAEFSPGRTWRYSLWRIWNPKEPFLVVIGLNPSTADESKNDPTIRRCIRFARDWDFGGYYMLNLFGYRATDPKDMKAQEDPIGRDNDENIHRVCKKAGLVLAAWGNHGGFVNRDIKVMQDLTAYCKVYCLGETKHGYPKHPLYVEADTQPRRYRGRKL